MRTKKYLILFAFVFAFGAIFSRRAAAQNVMTLTAVGNGERVRLSANGKRKTFTLEGTEIGDYTAGGSPPHRYTTLLSVRQNDTFYLVAKFTSGPVLGPNALCGGDHPTTLLLIETDKNLALKNVQTEIFASCIFNGAGRYVKGKPIITRNKVSISFDEGRKKYLLSFDAKEAAKGLQLVSR